MANIDQGMAFENEAIHKERYYVYPGSVWEGANNSLK